MEIIDAHSHINILGEDAYNIIDESVNVKAIIISALDLHSYEKILFFKEEYGKRGGRKKICVSLGLYPPSELKKDYENDIIESYDDDLTRIVERIMEDYEMLSAVGEIGLDGNAGTEDFASDRQAFKKQLVIADKMGLPVIIHSRKAEREVLEDIDGFNGNIILHTFSGKKSLIKKALGRKKIYFSLPCILSHSEHFKSLAAMVPLSRLLTETDSPFMPPKGKKYSAPGDILGSIITISDIKGMNPQETAQALYMNAKRIFPHV